MKIKTRKLRRMSKTPGLKRNYVLTVTTDIFRGWTEDFTFRSGVNGSFYILYIYIYILINNYSPKWRLRVMDIYRDAKWRGKYPPLSPTLR